MRCELKRQYSTKARAKQAAWRTLRIRGVQLWVYKCQICGFWHLTSQDQTLAEQIKGRVA